MSGHLDINDPEDFDRPLEDLAALKVKCDALQESHDKMFKSLTIFEALISESYGVAGYHLNGDLASWNELNFDEELAALAKARPLVKVKP